MLLNGNHIPSQSDYLNMLRLTYSKGKIYLLLPVMTDYTCLPTDFTSHYHIHPIYHIVFIFDGQGFLELTNHRIPIKPKDIVIINPMEKHIFITKNEYLNYFTINFYMIPVSTYQDINIEQIISLYFHNPERIKSYAETEKLKNIIKIKEDKCLIKYNPAYWKSIKQDIIAFRNNIQDYIDAFRFGSSNEFMQLAYLNKSFDFFTRMISRYFSNDQAYDMNNNDLLIQKIKNYLENNLDKNFDLKDLAEELGYNATYLSNHFSSKTDLTISEYFNRLKIRKACKYLKYTEKSIIEISNILGYNSPQYFNRVFKTFKNMTPREYRNNIEIY